MKKSIYLLVAATIVSLNVLAQGTQSGASSDQKWDKSKTADFVKKMASSNETIIQLSKMAQQKATSKEVKDLAGIVSKEDSDALQELHYAYKNIPAGLESKDKSEIDDLSKETGSNFDKKYIDKLVDRYQKDMEDLESSFSKVSEPSLKNWISTTMLTVNKNLDAAQKVQKVLGNKK
jgi:putative membrane protein